MAKDTTFNRWYKNHRDEFNEARRKRYAEDKAYRERMKESSRSTRKNAKQEQPA